MLDTPDSIELIRHVQHMVNAATSGKITADDCYELCEFAHLAGDSVEELVWLEDDCAIGLKVKHNPPVENFRLMDPLFAAGVMLMCLAGGKLNFEPTTSNRKTYYYLRYEHPHDVSEGKRIRVMRIIADAPLDQFAKFIGDHHDLRLSNIRLGPPIPNMKEPKLGRGEAIKLAGETFGSNRPAALTYLDRDAFESLLTEVFTTASIYHRPQDDEEA